MGAVVCDQGLNPGQEHSSSESSALDFPVCILAARTSPPLRWVLGPGL